MNEHLKCHFRQHWLNNHAPGEIVQPILSNRWRSCNVHFHPPSLPFRLFDFVYAEWLFGVFWIQIYFKILFFEQKPISFAPEGVLGGVTGTFFQFSFDQWKFKPTSGFQTHQAFEYHVEAFVLNVFVIFQPKIFMNFSNNGQQSKWKSFTVLKN